ncbi:hypothetical protein [Solicola sp. PLA-1-18]
MGTVLGTVVAFVAGAALATATVVGVVQTQGSSSNPEPVKASVVDYGSN